MRDVDGVPCLIIARFDRNFEDGRPHQIHQEDLCQALGALEKYEYDDEGQKVGPGFAELPAVLRAMSVPAKETPKIRLWAVFNLLIGNADAHGKNLSLVHHLGGKTELAPFYDLVCTARFQDLTTDLSMAFGRGRTPERLRKADFEQWAIDLTVKWPVALKSIREVSQSMIDAAEEARARMPEGGRTISTGIVNVLRRRVQMVSDVFGFGIEARPEPAVRAPGWRLPS